MAHLWIHEPEQEWTLISLDNDIWMLPVQNGQSIRHGETSDLNGSGRLVRSRGLNHEEHWVLVVPSQLAVYVNGERVLLGIYALSDKDEIRVSDGERLFFSTEKLACIEPFPETGGQRLFCPRCKQEIPQDCLAVQCPQCRVWHHQSSDLPCWLYSEHCTLCDQPSALNAAYRWTPEEL